MAGICPPKILDALIRRNWRQGALERGIVWNRNTLKITKKACRIQEEPEADKVLTTCHLLQPTASKTELRYMEAGEVVAILTQGKWSTVRIISKSAGGWDVDKRRCKAIISAQHREVRRQQEVHGVLTKRPTQLGV